MKKLRVLKVIVQPVFAIDDGDTLTEIVVDPIALSSADWPTYAEKNWPKAVAELEAKINES